MNCNGQRCIETGCHAIALTLSFLAILAALFFDTLTVASGDYRGVLLAAVGLAGFGVVCALVAIIRCGRIVPCMIGIVLAIAGLLVFLSAADRLLGILLR